MADVTAVEVVPALSSEGGKVEDCLVPDDKANFLTTT